MSFIVFPRAAVVVLGLSACAALHAQTAVRQPNSAASPRAAAADELGQRQALGVLSAINQAEINAGQLALSRAQQAATRQYAQTMVKEHSDNQQKLAAWQPDTTSAPAQAKAVEAQAEAAALARQQGAAFDAAYLQAMVADHRKALDTLDRVILPAASSADVRAFLKETRGHVANHLAQAQRLAGKPAQTD